MNLPSRPIVLVAVLAAPLACTSILGNDFEVIEGAGAGGSTSGGSGGSTSSGSSGEDCTNGSDDDGDDAVDCEDTDCAPVFSCVPVPPDGWSPPQASYLGPGPAAACPQSYPAATYEGVDDLVFSAAACSTCTCSSAVVGCNPTTLAAFMSVNCPGGQALAVDQNQSCADLPGSSQSVSFAAGAPAAVLDSGCVPTGGTVTDAPAPTWETVNKLCAREDPVGAGCEPAHACMPNVQTAGFQDRLCTSRAGDHPCPPPFNVKRVMFDDDGAVEDHRGCSACECTFSGTCTGTTTVYSTNNCTGVPASVPNNGTCVNTVSAMNSSQVTTSPSGSCPPSGGEPTGEVTPAPNATVTTVCCLP